MRKATTDSESQAVLMEHEITETSGESKIQNGDIKHDIKCSV